MNLQTNTIYLIGIGGIGMSALARYFKQQGKEVSGYDRTSTPLTKLLEAEGINIHYTDDPAYFPCDAGLVIYTPAIPDSNRELDYCREVEANVFKRAEVLGMIAEDHQSIAVAGTHGKTTISSMITHIMHSNTYPVTAFIGGIMSNYNTNMIYNEKSTYLVAEADEYDRSFLKLHPQIAVISTIDADHLDIYGSMENLQASFSEFISQVSDEGAIIVHESVKDQISIPENSLVYGKGDDVDLRIENIRIIDHQYYFELHTKGEMIEICMKIPGLHNLENATAAAGVCLETGMSLREIKKGLESYQGVKRRFEYIVSEKGKIFIDDYAHHPEEIAACITTVKGLYPEEKITGIFQPHLYSRTRDFAEAFASSLDKLDDIILLDIYPAREEPIDGIDSKMLLNLLNNKNKCVCSREDVLQTIKDKDPGILISMGAGDIDQLIEPIKEIMIAKA
jgi:UDP-N-acetylmuramate--alanine ligase